VTLSAYGGITYAWHTGPGDTLPTKTVSPGSTTSYIVTVTNGTCLTQSDTVTITVNTPPTATAGADKSICAGDSVGIGAASADSLTTVGSSTGSTASYPFRTNAEDQRAQMMYDADELFAAGLRKGYITAIAFQISSVSSTKPMSGFQMSLKNTSDTSLSSGFRSQMTPVLSMASYTPKPGWDTLYLDSAFLWDGRSNLVVETCFDNTGTPSSSGYGVHVETLAGFRVTYNYGNGGCSAAASFISYNRPLAKIIWQAKQYRWSPGAGLNRAIVSNPKASPGAGTTYTLVVTDSNGCMDADDALVAVYPTNPTTLTWTGAVSTAWSVAGNWDSPCATPTAGDTVIIPAAATAPAGVPASSLGGLTMGNASGLSLAGDVGISGVLTLTAGRLALGTYNLSIGPAGSISGGSAASFIVTDGSGELRQANIGSGGRTGNILFPIGDSAVRYSPVTVSNTGTADEFRARVSGAVLTGGTSGSPYTSNMVGKTWHISEAASGGSSATLQFQWDRIVELPAFTRSNSAVARHDGSTWTTITSYGATSGTNPYTRSAAGVSSFGAFAVGDIASPLPVELQAFTGRRAGASVELRWRTLSEINSLRYAVERRTPSDAVWSEIGSVPASGGSDTGIEYMFTDNAPPTGKRALTGLRWWIETVPSHTVPFSKSEAKSRPKSRSMQRIRILSPTRRPSRSLCRARSTLPSPSTTPRGGA